MTAVHKTPFWWELDKFGEAPALIFADSGVCWKYAELSAAIRSCDGLFFNEKKSVVCICLEYNPGAIISYLSALKAGHSILPVSENTARTTLLEIVERFRPDFLVLPVNHSVDYIETYKLTGKVLDQKILKAVGNQPSPSSDLCLVIPSSGTTGAKKYAKLSAKNILESCAKIIAALELGQHGRAILNLPLSHIFGLSVLHSYLAIGGSVVLEQRSIVDPVFWKSWAQHSATDFYGVPWTFQTMRKLVRHLPQEFRPQKIFQAGGKLDIQTSAWLIEAFNPHFTKLYFMYGMTEASGRISVLPPQSTTFKMGSVGLPLEDVMISFAPDGELIVEGPTVMIGYAHCRDDLQDRGQQGAIWTGDLGYFDADGYLYITGRKKRMAKVLGVQISLDQIEALTESICPSAALCDGNEHIWIFFESVGRKYIQQELSLALTGLQVPKTFLKTIALDSLPRLETGKIDYHSLQVLASQRERCSDAQ